MFSHRLVGKFFTSSKPPTLEETELSLREQWQQWIFSADDMAFQKLDDDRDKFLFEFRKEEDKETIQRMGPFYVNGVLLVLKDPNSPGDMIDFTVAKLGVAVMGLPLYLFNQEYLPTLKSKVGEFNPYLVKKPYNDYDVILFGVNVDLKKPLRPGYYLSEHRFVEFKYWNLGDFCYKCGMIGHIEENCNQVESPKERVLNATSTTQVYGPWLRFDLIPKSYETVLMKSENGTVLESEKTASYAQFIIEIENNCVQVSEPRIKSEMVSTHRFRFPCSYLDTKIGSTSKAYEMIRREISKNKPCCFGEIEDQPDVIEGLVEKLKLIQKNEFSHDDKWLTLKLKINHIAKLAPVEYETMLAVAEDRSCEQLIESKITDLVKRRVEEEDDQSLFFLPSWEYQVTRVLTEVGLAPYMNFLEVPRRATEAMMEAVRMKISSRLFGAR